MGAMAYSALSALSCTLRKSQHICKDAAWAYTKHHCTWLRNAVNSISISNEPSCSRAEISLMLAKFEAIECDRALSITCSTSSWVHTSWKNFYTIFPENPNLQSSVIYTFHLQSMYRLTNWSVTIIIIYRMKMAFAALISNRYCCSIWSVPAFVPTYDNMPSAYMACAQITSIIQSLCNHPEHANDHHQSMNGNIWIYEVLDTRPYLLLVCILCPCIVSLFCIHCHYRAACTCITFVKYLCEHVYTYPYT